MGARRPSAVREQLARLQLAAHLRALTDQRKDRGAATQQGPAGSAETDLETEKPPPKDQPKPEPEPK